MESVPSLLIRFLRAALQPAFAEKPDPLSREAYEALYRLSLNQEVLPLVASVLRREDMPDANDIYEAFQQKQLYALYRFEQIQYDLAAIGAIFETEQIPYVPLKGAVLCEYYPTPFFRTMRDLDILVQECDLERAVAALVRAGFQKHEDAYHDVTFLTPSGISLELHFSILEDNPRTDIAVQDPFSHAKPLRGMLYRFEDEFFLMHFFSHMAYHFSNSECGIRFLCDLWIIETRMGIPTEKAKELLEKAGLTVFASEMSRLAALCFGQGGVFDEDALAYLEHLLSAGLTANKTAAIAMQKASGAYTSGTDYLMQRLFLPFDTMCVLYPILRKLPFLLPFVWGIRILRGIFCGKAKKTVTHMRLAKNVPADMLTKSERLVQKLCLEREPIQADGEKPSDPAP